MLTCIVTPKSRSHPHHAFVRSPLFPPLISPRLWSGERNGAPSPLRADTAALCGAGSGEDPSLSAWIQFPSWFESDACFGPRAWTCISDRVSIHQPGVWWHAAYRRQQSCCLASIAQRVIRLDTDIIISVRKKNVKLRMKYRNFAANFQKIWDIWKFGEFIQLIFAGNFRFFEIRNKKIGGKSGKQGRQVSQIAQFPRISFF